MGRRPGRSRKSGRSRRPDEAVSPHQRSYANICSCRSSTPTSTPSTRRSSSATTRACAAAGDRRRRRRPRRELRGEGTRRPHRDGRAARPPPLPARGRRPAPVPRVRRREQGRVPRLRRPLPRSSRASRSTRRSSTSAASSGSAGTPREIAVRLRRAVLEEVGLPITVGVARTKFLAKVASGVAKPDGLLVVPPDAELEFLHPLPVERLWGVGPVTAEKLRRRGITTVGQVAGIPEAALVWMLGRASGRQLHALAHNRDPRPVVRRRRRRSIGSQCALGRGRALAGGDRRDRRRPRRRRRPAAAPGNVASAGPSCCDCGSTTSPAPRARARCGARPRTPATLLAALQELVAAARPLDRGARPDARRRPVANLDDDVPLPAGPPLRPRRHGARHALSTRCASASARRSVTRAVVLGVRSRRWSIDCRGPRRPEPARGRRSVGLTWMSTYLRRRGRCQSPKSCAARLHGRTSRCPGPARVERPAELATRERRLAPRA